MTNHTEGPWEVSDVDPFRVQCTSRGEMVAFTSGSEKSRFENIANATLISAAPEMLAVLNAAWTVLRNRDQTPQEAILLDAIKFAIGKAEGHHVALA